MDDPKILTTEEAERESHRHSYSACEIVLNEELLNALRNGNVLFFEPGEDIPVFITTKSFLPPDK